MSKRADRVALALKRFKGFWNQFQRSKRGFIGLALVVVFVIVAAIGPSLSNLDPMQPVWPGYYPAGDPPAAFELCVPIWYRYLPGGNAYSENMEAVADHTFSANPFGTSSSEWTAYSNNTNLATITYTLDKGEQNDGAIQISYNHQAGSSASTTRVILNCSFVYPYEAVPKRFWIHESDLTEGTFSEDSEISMSLLFFRRDPAPLQDYPYNAWTSLITTEGSQTVYKYPLITRDLKADVQNWVHKWVPSTHSEIWNDRKYYYNTDTVIFPTAGNYVFAVEILFKDTESSQTNVNIYLDNTNVLIYGTAFGLLGTDGVTAAVKDIFTSLMYGARISVLVGVISACTSVAIGLVIGLTAGFLGGVADEGLMRIADFLIGLPGLPLLIVLAVILKPSVWNIVAVLAFLGWMGFSRSVRSVTLSLRETAFVEAAKASGSGKGKIIFRHILPNVFPLVYLVLATAVPGAIVTEASVSFLGLFDPTLVTWGRMLNEFTTSGIAVTKGFHQYWFWILPPGIAISAIAIGFILVGYALDEVLNPRLRQRR